MNLKILRIALTLYVRWYIILDMTQFPTHYHDLGFKTLPVSYGKKASPPPGWTHTDSQELWGNVRGRSNVAIQAGPNNAFLLDPDTEVGSRVVAEYLKEKGIDAWKVITWRGYTHYWVRTIAPSNTQWNGKLRDGMGDWRLKNGYGLVAPSFVRMGSSSGFYREPVTNPNHVPFVEWSDLLPLLQLARSNTNDKARVTSLPVPVVRRALPEWLKHTLQEIEPTVGTPGPTPISVGSRHWTSRSEAVMSIVMSAILNGYSYREVMKWLDGYKTYNWWTSTTAKAVDWLTNEADRPTLSRLYNSEFDVSMKDQDVLRAMLSILWYVGTLEGGVSNRDIQMLVSRGRHSVSASVSRLMKADIISLVKPSEGKIASIYRVNPEKATGEREHHVLDGLHQEAFRHGGISPSQRKVVAVLQSTSMSVKDISKTTGISTSGVYYAVKRLRSFGIVTSENGLIGLCPVTKQQVHSTLDVQDKYLVRKHRIAEERRAYNRG